MKEVPLLHPERAAHASIRGYLYQTCLGVLRWLDLGPDEVLLCEGDEDLDRLVLGRGGVSEQAKAYTGRLGLGDQPVAESLRSFLVAYVALRRQGEERRFRFTTTASPKRQRSSGAGFDLLEEWRKGNHGPEVQAAARSFLQQLEGTTDALAWLDGWPDRWPAFLGAVEWSFDAPDLSKIQEQIRTQLAAREDTRVLPDGLFLQRLLFEVLDASSRKEARDRLLTRQNLHRLLETTRADLGGWAVTPPARRLREIFGELEQIERLLHDNTADLPPNPSPGKLLTAAYEVIPFDEAGRSTELEMLAAWCGSEARTSVFLLTGEGGSGKTRLMIEQCQRLQRQGWHAGFLRRDRGEEDLDPFLEGLAPRLVVVDYAETRLGVVQPLLLKMGLAAEGKGPKLRLVLLARRAGDWWTALPRADRAIEDLLQRSPQPRLITPLVPEPTEREQAFRTAVEAFAVPLGKEVPRSAPLPSLQEEDFARVLYLHMAALAALDGKRIENADEALERTLQHERQFWDYQIADLRLDASLQEWMRSSLETAVAALTLAGGAVDRTQTETVLRRCLPAPAPRSDLSVALIRRLQRLYGSEGGRYIGPLEPDLLGEQLIAEALEVEPDLLQRFFESAIAGEARAALTVLTRLAQRQPERTSWLEAALSGRLEKVAQVAFEVIVETGDPLGMAMAKILGREGSPELARELMKRCDEGQHQTSVHLREVALAATDMTFRLLREKWPEPEEDQQAELARVASNLGVRLSALGRREDALSAAHEAVEIYRKLAHSRPDAFLPDLAASLNNLGIMLRDLDRREDALSATHEAVEIYRKLAHSRPDAFLPDLAASLNNLGIMLSDLDRREVALSAAHEAIEIYRKLALSRPDAFLPDLGRSLNNLGNRLSDLDRREDALSAAHEAVEIYRKLALSRPDVFLPDLGRSLNNLGSRLSDLGHREDAFQAAEEAVRTLSPFFLRYQDAFRNWMEGFVENYRNRAAEIGRQPDEELLKPILDALSLESDSQSEA